MTKNTQNDTKPEQAQHDDNSEVYFLSLSKDDVLRLLARIALVLNGAIDSGNHQEFTFDRIGSEIDRGTIFKLLAVFQDLKDLALGSSYAEVREWLIAEWQSSREGSITERKYGVARNGLCLFLAYVIESIQMRTHEGNPWPGPEP